MKSKSLLLSAAVAFLAVVSAVFAFLLMQRQGAVQAGWEAFADRISQTAKILDKDSGNPVAGKLSGGNVSIGNAEKIGDTLKVLQDRVKAVIDERDAFADALRGIAHNVGASNVPGDAEMRALGSYGAAKDKVVNAVDQAISSRNKVYTRLADVSRTQLDATLDVAALRNGDVSAIMPMTSAIERKGGRARVYEESLAEISRIAGSDKKFNGAENAYRDSARAACEAVKNLREANRRLQNELNAANGTVRDRDQALNSGKATASRLQSDIADRDQAILAYKRALGLSTEAPSELPWKDGSPEARRALVGHVVKVNRDYGYIAIDVGTKTIVEQKLGNKTLPVNPQIEKGMEMIVSHGALGDDAEFVARVKLDVVGDLTSTADIPADANDIDEGDFVYLSL